MEQETITISKGAVKVRKGRFIIYDFDWLLNHLDSEVAHLLEVKKMRTEIKPKKMLEKFRKMPVMILEETKEENDI